MSCGVGLRLGSDLVWLWLWLWRRPAATAPIRPLAWEAPNATGAALEKAKRRKKKKRMCLKFNMIIDIVEFCFVFFCLFLLFLGPLPRHMEVPRLGVESEL